jgi:hypothetical protein
VASLPGTNEWTNNVADRVLISPLAPLSLLVVLERKVLPNYASERSCWVEVAAGYFAEGLVYANERNRDRDRGDDSVITVVVLETLAVENSHREDQRTYDLREHNLSISWLTLGRR